MTDPDQRFTWHPTYHERTVTEVRDEIQRELASDQRAYALALEGAEQHENSVLATLLELDKRWGVFDLGWAESDPDALADRIVAFERERDRRQQLFPFEELRPPMAETAATASSDRPWWARWRG